MQDKPFKIITIEKKDDLDVIRVYPSKLRRDRIFVTMNNIELQGITSWTALCAYIRANL